MKDLIRDINLTHNGMALLLADDWTPAGGGLVAHRTVLVEWIPGQKWSTHDQLEHEDGTRSLNQGHYYHPGPDDPNPQSSLAGAVADFNKRSRA